MKTLNISDVLSELCKTTGKWGIYYSISNWGYEEDELGAKKAAPWLETLDDCGWILFDTEEEMLNIYWQTVGDDGPTKLNSYNGQGRVYALTCGPDGCLINENT